MELLKKELKEKKKNNGSSRCQNLKATIIVKKRKEVVGESTSGSGVWGNERV